MPKPKKKNYNPNQFSTESPNEQDDPYVKLPSVDFFSKYTQNKISILRIKLKELL